MGAVEISFIIIIVIIITIIIINIILRWNSNSSKMEQMDHKKHRTKVAGPKAERKSKKKQKSADDQETAKQRNPKAFAIQSVVKAAKKFHRWETKLFLAY